MAENGEKGVLTGRVSDGEDGFVTMGFPIIHVQGGAQRQRALQGPYKGFTRPHSTTRNICIDGFRPGAYRRGLVGQDSIGRWRLAL